MRTIQSPTDIYMISLDCYIVVRIQVLKLVLISLLLLVYHFCLVCQSVSKFRFLWS
jgi:hypothetical protein